MKVGPQHVVDEFLLFVPVLCTTCLVLEYDIVVPSALHGKVFGVEQRVAPSNIDFTLLFLFGSSFGLLLGFSCSTLLSDLLELPLKGSFAVFIAVIVLVEH